MSRDFPSTETRQMLALEEISAMFEQFLSILNERWPSSPDTYKHREWDYQPTRPHRAPFDPPKAAELDLRAAEIVYGCHCERCDWWRSQIKRGGE